MARFWTSDLHLNHANIILYCNRPFKSSKRMDEVLINNINMRAKENDVLIHLGDFMCYGKDRELHNDKKLSLIHI